MCTLRKVTPQDDTELASVIRSVLIELGVPKTGTAYADPEVDAMTAAYAKSRSAYFVVEEYGKVIGGGGIAPLQGGEPQVCELQKMYFLPEARGRGLGRQLMEKALLFAVENEFSLCYIETLPYMIAAQKLYRKMGFDYIEGPMGTTGHTNCNVWMTKSLK